jgi:Flp pilus assembly protein TadG
MPGRRDRSGQAALEYVLVFVALIAVVWALGYFVSAARRSARQTAEMVTSDYP